MAPASSFAPRRGFKPLIPLYVAILACFAAIASAHSSSPAHLIQPASDKSAVPAVDPAIVDDSVVTNLNELLTPLDSSTVSSDEQWSAEDAFVMSEIISDTYEVADVAAAASVAAVEALVQPLMEYASMQGMMGTLLTAAQAAADAATTAAHIALDAAAEANQIIDDVLDYAVDVDTEDTWPLTGDAYKHLGSELLSVQRRSLQEAATTGMMGSKTALSHMHATTGMHGLLGMVCSA